MSFVKIPEARKTPNELIAQYTLEPHLKDVYVEGSLDKAVLELFFDKQEIYNVLIYDIASIDFSNQYLENPQLQSNREKLISLGEVLNAHFSPDALKARCVVDKDFDEILNVRRANQFIMASDFSSIEGYIIEKAIINKILKIGFPNFPVAGEVLIEQIGNVGVELFLVRCAREIMGFKSVQLLELDSACVINKSGVITFKLDDYINKLCQKNAVIKTQGKAILQKVNELRQVIVGDFRNYIHGHDFVGLFYKYVKVIKNTSGFKDDTFEKTVYAAIEIGDLVKYSLFQSLREIFSA